MNSPAGSCTATHLLQEDRPSAHQPPGLSDRAALFHFVFSKESEIKWPSPLLAT